jgi:hypothetical protein
MFCDILQYIFTIITNYLGITALFLTYLAQLCCFFETEFDNAAEGIANTPLPLNLIPEPYKIIPENTPHYK